MKLIRSFARMSKEQLAEAYRREPSPRNPMRKMELEEFAALLQLYGFDGAQRLVKEDLNPTAIKHGITIVAAAKRYANVDDEQDTSFNLLGKTLISIPKLERERFNVPEGLPVLARCACHYVGRITMPRSLKGMEDWYRTWLRNKKYCLVDLGSIQHPEENTVVSRKQSLIEFWHAVHPAQSDHMLFDLLSDLPKKTAEQVIAEGKKVDAPRLARNGMRRLFMATALSDPAGTVQKAKPVATVSDPNRVEAEAGLALVDLHVTHRKRTHI